VTYVEEKPDHWWVECDECGYTARPTTETEAYQLADQHDLAMGEVRPGEL
jgi:hypothetical protein